MTDAILCNPSILLAGSGLTTEWLIETLITHSLVFKRALGSGKVQEVKARSVKELGNMYVFVS